MGPQDKQVLPVLPVWLDSRESWDLQDHRDLKDQVALLDHQDH